MGQKYRLGGAAADEGFDNSGQDGGLHDGFVHGAGASKLRILQAGEVAARAGIREADFRGLYETFGDVGVAGPEDEDLAGGFQRQEPGLGRVDCDAQAACSSGEIEELS